MAKLYFREVQKFRQPWIWCLVVGSAGLMVWTFGYGLVHQLMLDKPWGSNPMSDMGLVLMALIMFAFSIGLVWLFAAMALKVEVRSEGLLIHFKPLKKRTVAYTDIANVEAVKYRPIAHYGGWGIKKGRQGWAYNVSGNLGVRLDFHDGKHLLLGSQRYTELAAAIEKARGH